MLVCGCNLPYLEANGIYTNNHSPDACIILNFRINSSNWSYSKFSIKRLHLSWLVPIFDKKNIHIFV